MTRIGTVVGILVASLALGAACGDQGGSDAGEEARSPEAEAAAAPPATTPPPAADRLIEQAGALFGPLPADAASDANPSTPERVDLGRKLYSDPRLSKNHDISCASCHRLDLFGVDGEPTSPGHMGQRGGRNSPTSLNAALHVAQFWDGRAADVEEQAKGPVLNPIEMAMPSAEAVEATLRSIPGYPPLFEAAFPGEDASVSFDNMALAIAAFERKLITPGPFDDFMNGDAAALSAEQQRGLQTFIDTGCITCHIGPAVGGGTFQKLGVVERYETDDTGRFELTGIESDRFVFKVPSLRNVAETGPWLHDGSIVELPGVVRIMAQYQLGKQLTQGQVDDIVAFLNALTGSLDPALAAAPELPESGPDTPAPDPG